MAAAAAAADVVRLSEGAGREGGDSRGRLTVRPKDIFFSLEMPKSVIFTRNSAPSTIRNRRR